jgi:hypothetical protein
MKTIMPSAFLVCSNFARQGLGLFLFVLVYFPLLLNGAQRIGNKIVLCELCGSNERSEWAVKQPSE